MEVNYILITIYLIFISLATLLLVNYTKECWDWKKGLLITILASSSQIYFTNLDLLSGIIFVTVYLVTVAVSIIIIRKK